MKFWHKALISIASIIYFFLFHTTFADVEIIFDTQFDTNQINNEVHAIYKDGQDLYIGGEFTGAGGENLNYLAKRDGFAWTGVGNGIDQITGGSINAIHKKDTDLYIGGNFVGIGGLPLYNNIAKRDGTRNILNGGTNGVVYTIDDLSSIYIGGNFTSPNYLGRWNTSSWVTVGGGINGITYAMQQYDNELYIGGDFSQADGNIVNNIAKRNGVTWTGMSNGTSGTVYTIETTSNGEIYIGGDFSQADGNVVNNIAKRNGSGRDSLGSGLNGIVYHIEEGYNQDLYVGGSFTGITNGESSTYLARWNGSSWNTLSGLQETTDGKINTMTKYGGDLYVGGKFKRQNSIDDHYFAKYYGEYLTYIVGYKDKGRNNVNVFPNGPIVNPLRNKVRLDKGGNYTVKVTYKNRLNRITTDKDKLDFFGNWPTQGVAPGEYGSFDFNIKVFRTNPNNWNIPGISISEGLVAYYSFDTGDGRDQIGDNNGIVNGATWTENGYIGGTYSFDGLNDYIDIGDKAELGFDSNNSFSISAWIKTQDTIGSIFGKIINSTPYKGYDLYLWGGSLRFTLSNSFGSNALSIDATTFINDGIWHHVVATYNGNSDVSGIKLYIDGSSDTLNTIENDLSASISNNYNITIGDRNAGSSHGLVGKIDEIRIYDRALSSGEIGELYNLN